MDSILIGLTGPLKAQIFSLAEDTISIGRDLSNLITINDLSVSRSHCLIKKDGEVYKISDLGSHNGTFINDIPIQERILKSSDRIKIGNSLFLFQLTNGETSSAELDSLEPELKVELTSDEMVTKTAVRLPVEDALVLLSRDLSALLRISSAIVSIRGLARLQHELLERIFEVIPADRGAILLAGPESEEPSTFGLERRAEGNSSFRLSRALVKQIMEGGVAIFSNNIFETEKLDRSESLIASEIKALLCVPLKLFDEVIGLIYLDATNPATRFDTSHLQLVTAIANIAAGVLNNARHIENLENVNYLLCSAGDIEHNMIGESQPMREVYNFIARVAPTEANILITGESGTGKELAAHAIHRNSPRAAKPFVAINCAALAETLLESELFGHEKGSFTGAFAQKKGKLEIAQGGTVFLDEIGETSLALQTKLLRVLQERTFDRVGGTQTINANIRFIAATNRDLERAIKDGTFRQDLFYRLNVLSLKMPPLRQRRDDLVLLANYFTAKYSKKCNRQITSISAAARAYFLNYDWPGNVRELENAIERAVVLSTTNTIMPEDLPEALLEREVPTGNEGPLNFHRKVKEAKRQVVLNALAAARNNYSEAAKLLGLHPNNLHRLIRNLDLKSDAGKTEKNSDPKIR